MIRWVVIDIDPQEARIVKRSLEYAIHHFDQQEDKTQCIVKDFNLEAFAEFGPSFSTVLRDLLEMHSNKNEVFYLTEYHFLVLYRVIDWVVGLHNAAVLTGGDPLVSTGRFAIDFKNFADRMFIDVDFLMTGDEYDSYDPHEKKALKFDPELSGICHGFAPHPDEMKTKKLSYAEAKREEASNSGVQQL